MPLTPSEQLVYDLCKKSFLSLWSYANPKQPKGKELTDVLAVFGQHVIVFSVKEIAFKEHADPQVAAARWIRKAIDASIDQLKGAGRILGSMDHVIRGDGSAGIQLPPNEDRILHFVAVAVGGGREVPFGSGHREFGYVHVIDEVALREILAELDTAPDFIGYLAAKEAHRGLFMCEGEENLFACYLHNGRKFPELDMLVVQSGTWEQVRSKAEFKARKDEDKISYWWDERIERLVEDCVISPEAPATPNDNELLVRIMASENRFSRRVLSRTFLEWLQQGQSGGRFTFSPATGVGYVFMTSPRDEPRDMRLAHLQARCLVARSSTGPLAQAGYPVQRVIGLATEVYDPSGWSMDAVYLDQPDWSDDDDRLAEEARSRFGLLKNPALHRTSFDEFPRAAEPKATTRRHADSQKRTQRKAKRKEERKSRKRNRWSSLSFCVNA